MAHEPVRELLERNHRLGADPRNTNYAGGNASAKEHDADGHRRAVELMWVKGSGGDLGTPPRRGWRCCGWTGCAG